MNREKLAKAVRESRETLTEIMDAGVPEIEAVREELRDARELINVLAHIVDGKPLDKAFGAPGDWGYGTPIGDALADKA